MPVAGIAQSENTDITIDNAAGTPTTGFEAYLTSGGIDIKYDTSDATGLSDLATDHTLGIRDGGEFNVDGIYTRTWAENCRQNWRCIATKSHTIVYSPDGSETHSFEALMTGFELDTTLGQTTTLSAKHKITGAVTLTAAS